MMTSRKKKRKGKSSRCIKNGRRRRLGKGESPHTPMLEVGSPPRHRHQHLRHQPDFLTLQRRPPPILKIPQAEGREEFLLFFQGRVYPYQPSSWISSRKVRGLRH